jgi:hypothetical protein
LKTKELSLLVFAHADGPVPSPWSAHKRAAVLPVSGEDVVERISRADEPFLLDLTGIDTPPLEEVFKRNGTILADPWDEQSDPGWYTHENISNTRVAAYTPLIYAPALLELRRLLEEKELGDLSGIELSASTSFRAVDLLYTVAHLLGPPSGCRIGKREQAHQDFESFLWYANIGCSVKLVSRVGLGQLEIRAACRHGMLISVSEEMVVRVFPAGKETYGFPLPDGDGIYYNLLDVIDTVLSPLTGGAFSAQKTANAIRWVQECVNERPSLLL